MRTIKVYSTSTQNLQDVEIAGNTFGDLKRALNISTDNVVGRGRTTKVKYESSDAVLSDEDSFIFVSPKKMDSGGNLTLESIKQECIAYIEEKFAEIQDYLEGAGCNEHPNDLDSELQEMIRKENS